MAATAALLAMSSRAVVAGLLLALHAGFAALWNVVSASVRQRHSAGRPHGSGSGRVSDSGVLSAGSRCSEQRTSSEQMGTAESVCSVRLSLHRHGRHTRLGL